MNIHLMMKQTERLIKDNSPAILTAIGATGVATTAYLASKASFRAGDILRQEELRQSMTVANPRSLETKERFLLIWKLYIPAVASGAVTCAAVVMANRVSARRTAAVASAFAITERALDEYKTKVVETVGKTKEQKIRDEVAQDRVTKTSAGQQTIIMTGAGDVLCYDPFLDRYFQSSMEDMKKAQNDLNYDLLHNGYASLNEFYSKLELPSVKIGEDLGWSSDKQLELAFTTTIAKDDRPCVVMDFYTRPVANFFMVH